MSDVQFRNESGLDFRDISTEEWREYVFSDGCAVRIEAPLRLYVSESGHRVWGADGVSHYVPRGWVHLKWLAKDGTPSQVGPTSEECREVAALIEAAQKVLDGLNLRIQEAPADAAPVFEGITALSDALSKREDG